METRVHFNYIDITGRTTVHKKSRFQRGPDNDEVGRRGRAVRVGDQHLQVLRHLRGGGAQAPRAQRRQRRAAGRARQACYAH